MPEDTEYSQLIHDLNAEKVKEQTPLGSVDEAIAAHAAIPTAHHPIPDGITGSKVVGGYRLTFTAGILTGFEQV